METIGCGGFKTRNSESEKGTEEGKKGEYLAKGRWKGKECSWKITSMLTKNWCVSRLNKI